MLDQQYRVAEISETLQCSQQSAIVARVQSDGWFVEHIQNSRERSACLTCQPNSLRLSSGKRWH